MKLKAERILLKPLELKHVERFHEYRSDVETQEYQGWIAYDMESTIKYLEKVESNRKSPQCKEFYFGVFLQPNQTLIGDVCAHMIHTDDDYIIISYSFDKDYHGQGYAAESVKRLIDFCFDDLNKDKVIANIDPINFPSEKLLYKLGFSRVKNIKQTPYCNISLLDDKFFELTKANRNNGPTHRSDDIISDRLVLTPLKLEYAEAFFNYRSDAETNVYQGWIPYGIEDCYDFIKNKIADKINTPETWFQYAVLKKDSMEMIGDVGILFIDAEGYQVELGCTFAKEHHGKGYATEALNHVINHVFDELYKHRIKASIDPENNKSEKLLHRLGFRKEAHFKESIFENGIWYDDVIYALLRSEWKTNI